MDSETDLLTTLFHVHDSGHELIAGVAHPLAQEVIRGVLEGLERECVRLLEAQPGGAATTVRLLTIRIPRAARLSPGAIRRNGAASAGSGLPSIVSASSTRCGEIAESSSAIE